MRKKLAILVVISSILVVISSILAVIRGSWLLCLIGKAWLIAVFFWEGWLFTPEAAVKGGFGELGIFWGVARKKLAILVVISSNLVVIWLSFRRF
jgi:uncharacterized membrane protein